MSEQYTQDETFERMDYTSLALAKGEYDNCTFINCNFAEQDLSGFKFIDCSFKHCNLSLVRLEKTALRDIIFEDSKMIGIRYENCLDFGLAFSFTRCQLHHSSFYGLSLKKIVFKECSLQEIDFSESDLSQAVFENCDLLRANFYHTNLEKADFRSACNYSIDPENNKLKKARFSVSGIAGLLDKYNLQIEH
ncbi:pentapeptide repeat-containing protein [Sphingobacterium spiritivorum]|uniref:Pentapeptide repeat protein n=1 Tax=Sphingobacterium spiritivorum ATCC 33861 TaxID=525373 RepID=D7VK21_SPHSI|nr:pentapeptide repeat-containing protein [Sphingobacterium spiritivorum]EFK58623.1 pentapeptide repeat protein [Sphingobacterium spiritivorum ATCC 33861]QQT34472.1 pentapeptide repeat-containing protein [Sphingobacterium spiritivorum]WQD35330.1 pentapeptide repeat-containing protein [Sphingobacterium spiritivorum]SUI99980.1 Uncharacterized protein conserved in bacteria [Sphingobacterium spiritivorum]